MTAVYIDGVGIAAPGLPDWSAAQAVLQGAALTESPLGAYAPTLLPANEQRRATATVRIAFRVAEAALRQSSAHNPSSASALATVFASSDADMMVSHRICTALAQTQRLVSPTDFHNSVHNAPSGYWHIGAKSQHPSSAVAGYDYSFAVGLLEAIAQVQMESQATLLVCYDVPAPEPLLTKRPLRAPFAVALLLQPERTASAVAKLSIETLHAAAAESALDEPLESVRTGNPAARSLPLFQRLANRQSGTVVMQRSAASRLGIHIEAL